MPPRTALPPLGMQGAAMAVAARLVRPLHGHIGADQACIRHVPGACSRHSSSNTRKGAPRDALVGQRERPEDQHGSTMRSRAAVRLSARNSRRALVLESGGRAAPARVGEQAGPVRWSCPSAWCKPTVRTGRMRPASWRWSQPSVCRPSVDSRRSRVATAVVPGTSCRHCRRAGLTAS
jgi:hypothetical protein